MAWKLFAIAYNRLEATLNGYKGGKSNPDWQCLYEHSSKLGTLYPLLILVLLVCTMLVGKFLSKEKQR